MAKRILVVEDEPAIRELLALNLSMSGYQVTLACTAEEALDCLKREPADLLVVDWNMPGQSGLWLLRHLRATTAHLMRPVIMLTAREDELDKVLALESGADDYVTKPFRVRELLARVQSVIRRSAHDSERDVFEIDGLCLYVPQQRAVVGSKALSLSPTEFKLLHYLASHAARIHSREQLLDRAWGNACELQERTVDAYVARLRVLMDAAGHHQCIETVRSVGYRFVRLDDAAKEAGQHLNNGMPGATPTERLYG